MPEGGAAISTNDYAGIGQGSPFRPHRGVYAILGVLSLVATAAYEGRRALGWELSLALVVIAVISMFAVGAGFRLYCTHAQRALNERAEEGLRSGLPIVLYLRPFMSSGNLFVPNRLGVSDRILMGWHWDAELALSLAVEGKARLVAVGGGSESVGAAKITVDDAGWKAVMQDCAERAAAIIAVPLNRPSTLWEMAYLRERPRLLAKTLFFMPPGDHGAMAREWWQEGQKECLAIGLELPDYRVEGGWARVGPTGAWTALLPLFAMGPASTWEIISALFPSLDLTAASDDDFAVASKRLDLRLKEIVETEREALLRAAEEAKNRDGKPPPQTLREQAKDALGMLAIVVGLIGLLVVGFAVATWLGLF